MDKTIIPACINPPHFWEENTYMHIKICVNCGAVVDLAAAHKKMLRVPVSKGTPSDPYFVPIAKIKRIPRLRKTAY